jgi:cytochrome P450
MSRRAGDIPRPPSRATDVLVWDGHGTDTVQRRPALNGVNRPAGPDKHPYYSELVASGPGVVPILGMDGEQHNRVRAIVKDAFTPSAVSRLRELVEADALDQLKTMMALDRPVDLVEDYATPFALRVISDMLGVPEHDRDNFRAWGRAFLGTADLTRDQATEAANAMGGYLAQLIEQRRADPGDDLTSRIAVAGAGRTAGHLVNVEVT